MLEFWYSKRCTREIKLVLCIAVCAVVYWASQIQQLTPLFAGLSLAIGIAIHLMRSYAQQQVKAPNQAFHYFRMIAPVIALLILISQLPTAHRAILALQCICFSALALFLMSIYENRAKRFE